MTDMNDFYKNGFISYNDLTMTTKEAALRTCLLNYYQTGTLFSQNHYNYLHKTPNGIFQTKVRSSGFLVNYFTSIAFIHLFFKHTIFQVLGNVNPFFSNGEIKNEGNIAKVLAGDISSIKVSDNHIKYNAALDRLESLIDRHDKLPIEFKIPSEYHFFKSKIPTLRFLASLRNDIIHSGQKILDRYHYEAFFINELLPVIRKILDLKVRNIYFENKLNCSLNVIDDS